jgi:hypothetical protein
MEPNAKGVGRFPIGYVEEGYALKIAGEESIKELVNFKSKLCIDRDHMCFSEMNLCRSGKSFVEVVYERIPELILDAERGTLKSDIAIYSPVVDQVLYVPSNTRVFLVEASGRSIYPLVSEGENVSNDRKLFYVVTNKFEVRVVRAGVSGVVIYVGDVVGGFVIANKMLCIIVSEKDVCRLRRCNQTSN